ncbi:site-specific integrase [Gordonia sp. PP30]|uniref:tyrosine-type recombinase/integrase n=1 Tax=Gordonia sp. PP30 TaxID=2935861 RepID=UPI001FFF824D|nr:site-specific integrase [Gordonia sp. PP30]UQE75792.1 site-specific integrase [Gordonia sp. PP30]
MEGDGSTNNVERHVTGMSKRRFGNVRKLPSGRYQARYTGPDLRIHKGPRTWEAKDDAVGWLRAEERLVELDLWRAPEVRDASKQAQSVSTSDYADKWIRQRRLKPTTRAQYESYCKNFLDGTDLGSTPVGVLTLADVRDWWSEVRSRPAGKKNDGATRNARVYAWLRTVLASAVDDGLLDQNPCRIKGAGTVKRQRAIVVPTPAEVSALADEMPDRLHLLVLLAAWCAMRRGELLGLRRRDVAKDGSELIVRRNVTFVERKPVVGTLKNEKERPVAVPPHLHAAVVRHLDEHVPAAQFAPLFPSVVADNSTGDLLDEWTLRYHWETARRAVGLDQLRLHDLRHAGSMWAASTGATLSELQQRLGHESAAAAIRYMHAASGSDKAIAERLSALVKDVDDE